MKLYYQKIGKGQPVLILHGLLGSGDNWITMARKLSEKYEVYLVDIRNHGRSPHDEIHSYKSVVEDIEELILSENINNIHIVGHSMGGKAAMLYTAFYPEKTRTLTVIDIAPDGYNIKQQFKIQEDSNLFILNSMLSTDLANAKSRTEIDNYLSGYITNITIRQFIMKNLQRNSDKTFSWKPNIPVLIKFLPEIMGPIDINPIDNIPVLFLKGELSGYISENHIRSVFDFFPEAKIITVPGAGHWIHSDKPDFVISELLTHFNHK